MFYLEETMMIRGIFLALAITTVFASGCSTLRALGQADQIGPTRQALLEFLPTTSEAEIRDDLFYLDNAYEQVQAIVSRDPDIGLKDVVVLALGSPEAFERIGVAYANIRGAVNRYSADNPSRSIPVQLVTFNSSVTPAYRELKTALNASERVRQGAELALFLRPIAILAL